tara:strand:- start:56 stop:718 length:663 start_codon:yes stop_codon:yes gene_type:complete
LPKEAVSGAVTGITDSVFVVHQSVRMTHTIHQQMRGLGPGYHGRKYRHCGYSLLELLSVMGFIAAMMTLVVPAFSTNLAQGRVITASHDMMTDLQTARFTAISRQQIVVVCPSTDGNACANNSRWESGWILFVDEDADRRRSSGEPLIIVHGALPNDLQLRFRRPHRLFYRPDGSAWPNGHFRFCSKSRAARPRAVIIYRTGRNRVSDQAPGRRHIACPA